MYHSVQPEDGRPGWPWAVSLRNFERQLDLLKEFGWRTYTVRELARTRGEAGTRAIAITFDDGFADNLAALDALNRRGMRATWFVVTNSLGREPRWPDPGRPTGNILNSDNLKMLLQAGMEVGSHSHSHRRLPALDSKDLKQELTESRAKLEAALGEPITSFAYPYGDWNTRCEAAVRSAGFGAACTTQTGRAFRDENPLRIRRLTIFNTDTPGRFARKLWLADNEGRWITIARYFGRRARLRLSLGDN